MLTLLFLRITNLIPQGGIPGAVVAAQIINLVASGGLVSRSGLAGRGGGVVG